MPKCAHCKQPYTRTHNGIETWCSVDCGYALARAKQAKTFKAETKVMKKAIADTDRSLWIKKAQTAFNAYIRARDAGLPCISCGVINPAFTVGGMWDAGHFKSRGAYPELRFTEDNCHRQCKKCNGGSGNFSSKAKTVGEQYEIELVKRIGIERVEALKAPHPPAKWTIPELKEIEATYKAKLKALR